MQFTQTIKVTTGRLDSLAARLGITHVDFMHLDVQGAELMVLAGAGALLDRTWNVWLEVEAVPLYRGQPLRGEVERFLGRHGFVKLLDTVGDVDGDQFWSKAPWLQARKGRAWVALTRLAHWHAIGAAKRRVKRALPRLRVRRRSGT